MTWREKSSEAEEKRRRALARLQELGAEHKVKLDTEVERHASFSSNDNTREILKKRKAIEELKDKNKNDTSSRTGKSSRIESPKVVSDVAASSYSHSLENPVLDGWRKIERDEISFYVHLNSGCVIEESYYQLLMNKGSLSRSFGYNQLCAEENKKISSSLSTGVWKTIKTNKSVFLWNPVSKEYHCLDS